MLRSADWPDRVVISKSDDDSHAEHKAIKYLLDPCNLPADSSAHIDMYVNWSPCNSESQRKTGKKPEAHCCHEIWKFLDERKHLELDIKFGRNYYLSGRDPDKKTVYEKNIAGLIQLASLTRVNITKFGDEPIPAELRDRVMQIDDKSELENLYDDIAKHGVLVN